MKHTYQPFKFSIIYAEKGGFEPKESTNEFLLKNLGLSRKTLVEERKFAGIRKEGDFFILMR